MTDFFLTIYIFFYRIVSATPSRTLLPEAKAAPSSSTTIPYIPSPHFTPILGPSLPSSSFLASSPPSVSAFTSTTSFLSTAPSTPAFSFSATSKSNPAGPIYPANPLSSHLYGAASKAAEQKAAEQKGSPAPAKQKVKFSDTVTQIVVAVRFFLKINDYSMRILGRSFFRNTYLNKISVGFSVLINDLSLKKEIKKNVCINSCLILPNCEMP